MSTTRTSTVVIGGGQAGLVTSYRLSKAGRDHVVLDASERTGDAWRKRWDSLCLFTPARYSGLDGMPFPAPSFHKPTKDEMAEYLEAYAERFDLPVRHGVQVEAVTKDGDRFVVTAGADRFVADEVVVATGAFNDPYTPAFADELDPAITQIHSCRYSNPSQLEPGPVLIVGAGNSGADIAIETSKLHPTIVAGRHPGHVPFRIDSFKARFLVRVVRNAGQHVLTWRTPIGRKVLPKLASGGWPLVRVKPKDLVAAGVQRVGRVEGVVDGKPQLDDGQVVDVANVIWCTGFRPNHAWVGLDAFDDNGHPVHERGISTNVDGLYFVGMAFQYAATSDTITGVRRDAAHVVRHIASRKRASDAATSAA